MSRKPTRHVIKLAQTSPVTEGQRWLITAARAPWKQNEDLTLTVDEVYTLKEHELKAYDLVTAANLRGEEYCTVSDANNSSCGLNLPVSLLVEVGELQ